MLISNKPILYFCLLLLVFCTFCTKDEEPNNTITPKPISNSINKILPLGASRVEGHTTDFESYRYELWKLLNTDNWEFDFIGTRSDLKTYENKNFDIDHEGRSGWTSGQIATELDNWLNQVGAPDIVLFSSPGGNDALLNLPYETIIYNINQIIDTLQAKNPNVTIIVEQLAPVRSTEMTPELTILFNQIQEDIITIANNQSTSNSKVITVDIASGFNDSFYSDNIHYNHLGAQFVAQQYFSVLANELKK